MPGTRPPVPARGRGRGRGRGKLPAEVKIQRQRSGKSHTPEIPHFHIDGDQPLPPPPHPLESLPAPLSPHPIDALEPALPPPLEPHPSEMLESSGNDNGDAANYQQKIPPLVPSKSPKRPLPPAPLKSPPIPVPHPLESQTPADVSSQNKIVPPPPAVIGAPPPPDVCGTPPRPIRGAPRGRVTPNRGRGARGRGSGNRGRGKPVGTETPNFIISDPSPIEVSEWYPLINLYTHNDHIITKAAIKATDSADLDSLAPSLVNAFAANKDIWGLLKPLMKQEVDSTEQAGTLFRGNCIASKALSSYCKAIGTEFLQQMLRAPVTYVAEVPANYEINPAKLPADQDIQENLQNLRQAVHFFLKNITLALPQCPPIIRDLCQTLRELVAESYPESTYTVIGGFFFLRFVGPAIVSPEGYDVIDWKIPPHARRSLVLISKVIQNIGNGVEFGKKEGYMLPLNDLIQEKIPEIHQFFDDLASPTSTAVPPHVEVDDHLMKKLHSHTFLIQNKIMKYISAYETEMKLVNGSEMKNFSLVVDFLEQPALMDEKDFKAFKKQMKKKKH